MGLLPVDLNWKLAAKVVVLLVLFKSVFKLQEWDFLARIK
jgi:hypothetical protein